MKISVSNLCFLGTEFSKMRYLPKEYGIEVFIEFGSQFYWDKEIKKVMNGRDGKLSIHGPFISIDLASLDFNESHVFDIYKWAFDYYNKYEADFYVQHISEPYYGKLTDKARVRNKVIERLVKLADIAKKNNINIYIENTVANSPDDELFDFEEFINIFKQIKKFSCLIDIGHAYISQWDLLELIAELGPRIKAYHLHDNKGRYDNHLHVGEGLCNWPVFFKEYKKNTPNAVLVLEYALGKVDSILKSISKIRAMYHT